MTISRHLIELSQILEAAGIDDPLREASSLLGFAINKDKTFIFAHPEYELTEIEAALFRTSVQRRAGREPFHYIVGRKEFFGLDFEVTPDVLIPRPETEMLVQHSIEILSEIEDPVFCEVGVGSGCIAISMLHVVQTASAVGLEISEGAIAVAKRNAERNDVANRLNLCHSNVYSALKKERFDLIVSNPPYVPAADIAGLQPEVRDFEPHGALTDGTEGLLIIETIVERSPEFLQSGCFLIMEIGIRQADNVKRLFDPSIWQAVEILPDFQSIPRMVRARLR
ncbi:MAG: peptide chain release factor N(5)-glutamine methyltransferase [Saprospiraceae bacterium]|nr:peptide chain release factor N(5)-glutamine methyltransferase [Pyrinomonadaceae bacterium]